MCVFRSTPELDTTFLLYVLNGPIGRAQAMRAAVGAAHPHINLGEIEAYEVPMPSLKMQMQIVRQLGAVAAEIKQLESIYQQKLNALDALKKSLLHQAFTGAL
jgi:type I restriction enzyme S subunit